MAPSFKLTGAPFPDGEPMYVCFREGQFYLQTADGVDLAYGPNYRHLAQLGHDKSASEVRLWEDLSRREWV